MTGQGGATGAPEGMGEFRDLVPRAPVARP